MKKEIFYAILVSLATITVFSMGYFTANVVKLQKPSIVVEKISDNTYSTVNNDILQPYNGRVVASVNSDKYHYEHCPGAKRIKEENKIYFTNNQEAVEAGYELAGNCQ
ncbi:MAG: hypothetical protein R3346_01860 [Candidatus Spechtbacterales bacterium]|nr:hypothetical protein [Candidatus Spechtbacterales bacterium]